MVRGWASSADTGFCLGLGGSAVVGPRAVHAEWCRGGGVARCQRCVGQEFAAWWGAGAKAQATQGHGGMSLAWSCQLPR
eukprot:11004078-Alexandrium_andersonii.AAC.1